MSGWGREAGRGRLLGMAESSDANETRRFVARGDNQVGPYSTAALLGVFKKGVLRPTDMAWSDRDPNPIPVSSIFAANGAGRDLPKSSGLAGEASVVDVMRDEAPNNSAKTPILEKTSIATIENTKDVSVSSTEAVPQPQAERRVIETALLKSEPIARTWSDYTNSHENRTLPEWALIPGTTYTYDDKAYKNPYDALKELALPERWQIGEGRTDRRWPLLQRYIFYTFERLRREEGKIYYLDREGQKWAVFNTGLVDKLYRSIYMLFGTNPNFVLGDAYPPWKFWSICTYGQKREGKKLENLFRPVPPAAKYLDSASDLIIPPGEVPTFDEEHVIFDAIEDDRYPPEFLLRFKPPSLEWEDYTRFLDVKKKRIFLHRYRTALEFDNTNMRLAMSNRVEDAAKLASRRTFWNYKTAIPAYYPAWNEVNLLLPLCLDDKDETKVTIAMVVSKTEAGGYTARTVFPLEWAYERARVVCRPDSDWLMPDKIDLRENISSKDAQVDSD
jgi:hypothetical protein